jgi:hypothetical protein
VAAHLPQAVVHLPQVVGRLLEAVARRLAEAVARQVIVPPVGMPLPGDPRPRVTTVALSPGAGMEE